MTRFTNKKKKKILNYCHTKNYTKSTLIFDKWCHENIIARDSRGFRYVVVGSMSPTKYVLRGVVRERRRNHAFTWQINGQSSTGSIQVAHIGESDSVEL